MKPLYLIAAADQKLGIGVNNQLPWNIPADLKFFQETTQKTANPKLINAVIMGRKTWESIPKNHRPLKNRLNIVLSRNNSSSTEDFQISNSIDEAIALCDQNPDIENIFIIGGSSIYQQSINHPRNSGIFLTHIMAEFPCDSFFPAIPAKFKTQELIGQGKHDNINYEFYFYKI